MIRPRYGNIALISSEVEIANSYVIIGERIDCRDVESIGLWINLDINSSTDVVVKAYAYLNASDVALTNGYELPIRTVSSTQVSVQDEVTEFSSDADQKMVLEVETGGGIVPYIEFYVKDAADGTGQIDNAYLTFRMVSQRL